MMEAAKRTLDRAPTTGEASASIQEAITTAKIDELLKPKELRNDAWRGISGLNPARLSLTVTREVQGVP